MTKRVLPLFLCALLACNVSNSDDQNDPDEFIEFQTFQEANGGFYAAESINGNIIEDVENSIFKYNLIETPDSTEILLTRARFTDGTDGFCYRDNGFFIADEIAVNNADSLLFYVFLASDATGTFTLTVVDENTLKYETLIEYPTRPSNESELILRRSTEENYNANLCTD